MAKENLEFKRGYYCAVANIMRLHDAHVVAEDVLRGYGGIDTAGIDGFDLETLSPIIAEINRKEKIGL